MNRKGQVSLFVFSVFLIWCIPDQKVVGQFSYSINYTVNDGLPSSKVYDMLQDYQGYIWFATENGVSRYNGYEFENFTTAQGLPTNSTVKLYEDYKKRIWFLSYQGSLSYFENDSIKPLSINEYLNDKNIPFIANLYVDTTDAVWLSPFNGGLYRLVDGNLIEEMGMKHIDRKSIYFYLWLRENGHILAYVEADSVFSENQQDIIAVGENEYYIRFDVDRTEHHYGFLQYPDFYLLSFGKKVYRAEKDRISYKLLYDHEIVSINSDNDNNVWISEKFSGVYQYPAEDIAGGPVNHFLPERTVSKVLQDTEGNYWFSTTEYGVYFVPSLAINSHHFGANGPKNEIILSSDIFNNTLFFSTDGKELYTAKIVQNKIVNLQSLELDRILADNVYAIYASSENSILAAADPNINLVNTVITLLSKNVFVHTVEYGYDLTKMFNGDYALAYANGLKIISGNRIVYSSPESIDMRIFSVEQAPDSSLWLGSINGLFQFRDSIFHPLYPEHPGLSGRISTLLYNDSKLWAGTFDNGLFILADDSIYALNTSNGLSSNRIKSLFVENDSVTWVGTNKGLNRIKVSSSDPLIFDVNILDIWDGLPSNEINTIKKSQGYVWLGTDKGFVSFAPDEIKFRHMPPRLYLRNIQVEDLGNVELSEHPDLNFNQNNISFTYNAVCFRNPASTVYSYQMLGLNSKPNETINTSVRYHDLDAGTYTFVVQARNQLGDQSEKVYYRFTIRKHFTQTFLFISLVVILALAHIAGALFFSIRTQRRRAQLQRKIFLAEQKAMLAQMNPHFIFNSLNSIQNFILDNDSKNANIYLVTFSSLIRKILDGSQRNFISLKDELETIKLYLELEKFRFAEKFNYHIEVNAGIKVDRVFLPSMILQPYLENAIWHGIVPKNDHGLVQLIVARTQAGGISISIRDNGIGREKAAVFSKRRKLHKSTGIKNVEDRIKLLNKLNKTNMQVKITDLHDANGTASGTLVELYLEGWAEDV